MKKIKVGFSAYYNDIDDVLSIYDLNKKVSEVYEFSEFINVSFDKYGCVVGLEIFDANQFFKLQNPKVNFKSFLSKLNKVEIEQVSFRGNWFLVLYLSIDKEVIRQQLPPFRKEEYKSPLLCSI